MTFRTALSFHKLVSFNSAVSHFKHRELTQDLTIFNWPGEKASRLCL